MAEPADMILPLLREMRAENATRHSEVIARLQALELVQASFKQALAADSLLSKLVTGEFEERIGTLERKVCELESRQ